MTPLYSALIPIFLTSQRENLILISTLGPKLSVPQDLDPYGHLRLPQRTIIPLRNGLCALDSRNL